jgi:hypothetical protein
MSAMLKKIKRDCFSKKIPISIHNSQVCPHAFSNPHLPLSLFTADANLEVILMSVP